MIRQLVLIAVLALNQSLYTASDQSRPPEHNQAPDSNAAIQTADFNTPSQVPIPPTEIHADTQGGKFNPAKDSQEAKEDTKYRLDYRYLIGLAIAIATLWLLWRKDKRDVVTAKAAAESAKRASIREPARMTVESIRHNYRPKGSSFTITWIDSGDDPAIIHSARAQYKLASQIEPIPEYAFPEVARENKELRRHETVECSTDPINFTTRLAIIAKNKIAYIFSRVEYSDHSGVDMEPAQAQWKIAPLITVQEFIDAGANKPWDDMFKIEPILRDTPTRNGFKPESR